MTLFHHVTIPIRYPLVLYYCIALHLIWSVMLLLDDSAGRITAMSDLYRWMGSALAPFLLVVALAAVVPMFRTLNGLWPIVFFMPQQLVLMVAAGTAISAMVGSAFADGVVRPRFFIIADQTPAVLAAVFHTLAVIGNYWEGRPWVRR